MYRYEKMKMETVAGGWTENGRLVPVSSSSNTTLGAHGDARYDIIPKRDEIDWYGK